MRSMRCVIMLAGLAATSCSISSPFTVDTRLEIEASSWERLVWPIPEEGEVEDTFVELRNSLTDPSGLAGIELQVSGSAVLMLTAADLDADGVGPTIDVPESGSIQIHARLRQDGLVAEGRVSWDLIPDAIWRLVVSRSPYVLSGRVSCDFDASGWLEAEHVTEAGSCDGERNEIEAAMDLEVALGGGIAVGVTDRAHASIDLLYTLGLIPIGGGDPCWSGPRQRVLTLRAGLAFPIG